MTTTTAEPIRTTVDGAEAVIDGTVPRPEPLIDKPTLDEQVDRLRDALAEYDERKREHKAATDALKDAKEEVDERARAVVATHDDPQLTLGATTPAANDEDETPL